MRLIPVCGESVMNRRPFLEGPPRDLDEPRSRDALPSVLRLATTEENEPARSTVNHISEAVGDRAAVVNVVSRTTIDEIALLIQSLTYGEMIEFADAMW